MAVVIKFKHYGFTASKYHEVVNKLQEAGEGHPKGRTYHICYGNKNEVDIMDIWESKEDFEAFGKKLIPILTSFNVKLGEPDIQELFGVIEGHHIYSH